MAAWYVWSGATGTADGLSWANAKTTLAAAITAAAAGDTYYVASDHAESTAAALTLTFKGTAANRDLILSVSRAGSVPPVAADLTAGASVATTLSNNLNLLGNFYCYGVKFAAGSSTGTAAPAFGDGNAAQVYDSCILGFGCSGFTAGRLGGTANNSLCVSTFINCQFIFGATNQYLGFDGSVQVLGPSATSILATGSLVPTTLFGTAGFNTAREILIRDADLSAIGSGGTLWNGNGPRFTAQIVNCKINASVTVSTTPSNILYAQLQLIGCNSSGNVQRNEIYDYLATLTTETTIIRTGGASDGTTGYSWKIVTTANNKRKEFAFTAFEGSIWNDVTGSSKTLTVHTVTDNITLNSDELWLEVDYLGASGSPMATRISSGVATILTAGSANATDTATWTTTGLTTPVKQQLQLTFTPQSKGPIRWRIRYVRTSGTVYVCPKADLV